MSSKSEVFSALENSRKRAKQVAGMTNCMADYYGRLRPFLDDVYANLCSVAVEPARVGIAPDVYAELLPKSTAPDTHHVIDEVWGLPAQMLGPEFKGCYQIRCIDSTIYTFGFSASALEGAGSWAIESVDIDELIAMLQDIQATPPIKAAEVENSGA